MRQAKGFLLLSLGHALILALLTAGVSEVQCQAKYPTRPIDVIVPYAPGGGTDLSARVMTAYLSKRWNVPINVINKPGGNTIPACLETYKARPDGYTVMQDGLGSGPMLEAVLKEIPFKILDRSFIGIFTAVAMVIVVPPNSPIKSLKDLETEAKNDPGSFTWTSLGGAAAQDYTTRKFFKVLGVDVSKTKPVMSQGASQAIVLTAGGSVKMGVASTSASLPAVRGGTVRPIAITSSTRHPDFPDVPTSAEQGYPAVNTQDRYGPSGPPALPSDIVDTWENALKEMVKDPEVISKLRNIGQVPFYRSARETREIVIGEIEELKELWGRK